MVRQIGIRVVDGIAGVGRRRTRGRGPNLVTVTAPNGVKYQTEKENPLRRMIGNFSERAMGYLKKTRHISNALKRWGHPNAAGVAHFMGVGRRRTYRRKRTMGGRVQQHKISVVHGGGIFDSLFPRRKIDLGKGRRSHLPPRSNPSM